MSKVLTVVGGGVAGTEAAWQAANRGTKVRLYEMRPKTPTGAHTGAFLAELVCSNSLGSNLFDRASGVLKDEMRKLGSLLIECADANAVTKKLIPYIKIKKRKEIKKWFQQFSNKHTS